MPPSSATHAVLGSPNNVIMSRLESSIMGESALIDKETGRVLWEGGSSSTLTASMEPRLSEYGFSHVKASLLSGLLLLALLGAATRSLQRKIDASSNFHPTSVWATVLVVLLRWTVFRLPTFQNWFITCLIVLYFIEAWSCSTRRYLANAISSPDGVEAYIEQLRHENPEVQWKVRCFHYENLRLLLPMTLLASTWRRLKPPADDFADDRQDVLGPSSWRRKVVTNRATGAYKYKSCADKTFAGVWKRASMSSISPPPFTKVVLSTLLVLPNTKARDDYMKQQSQFVMEQGQGDQYAEFATSIHVKGFRPRLLAARPVRGMAKLFRLHYFWLFTVVGLSVPYRMWFSDHCEEVRVTVVKETSPDVHLTSSRSWFSSKPSLTINQTEEESFRLLMQQLKLYATNGTASEKYNATALIDDVETAEFGQKILADDIMNSTANVNNTTNPEGNGEDGMNPEKD